MTVQIQRGEPRVEGQYVAFVNGDRGGFLEARILTWHGGRWHYWRPVYGWIGPIPVLEITDFDLAEHVHTDDLPAPTQEFDL